MEWYLPITILPAVCLLIMSTTSQMMGLSTEVGNLVSQNCTPFQHEISAMKIRQLRRLTISTALLYSSAALFVLSGLVSAAFNGGVLSKSAQYVLIIGVLMFLAALFFLIFYGFRTITIRRLQHRNNQQQYNQ